MRHGLAMHGTTRWKDNFHVHRRLPPSITTQLSHIDPIILALRIIIGHALPVAGRLRRPLRASGRPVQSRTYFNARWRTRRQNRSRRRGLCRSCDSCSSEFAAEQLWMCQRNGCDGCMQARVLIDTFLSDVFFDAPWPGHAWHNPLER